MKSQTNLFSHFGFKDLKKRYGRTEYGGLETKGHRKLERPLATKKWIHLILKSDKAKGQYSLLKHKIMAKQLLDEKARKFHVRIGDYANIGNHLHIKIRIKSRRQFQKFLKSVTTLLARKITGARRGRPFGPFWSGLAYTRVLTSALEELNLRGYFEANRIQARSSYRVREQYLRAFQEWVRLSRAPS